MPEELFILLGANTVVDECKFRPIFNKETSHGPGAEIIFISGVGLLPDGFRNNTKHGAAVKFKEAGVDDV